MVNLVKRFTHLDASTKINFLIYPFFLATLSYGIGFVAFSWTGWVEKSSLFTAMSGLHPALPIIWGVAALVAVICALLLIATRIATGLGDTAALFGTMVWIFAGLCYALTGGWLLVFAVAAPNLIFWTWYFFRLSGFRRVGVPDPEVPVDTVVR